MTSPPSVPAGTAVVEPPLAAASASGVRLGVAINRQTLVIQSVTPGMAAEMAGLQPGDQLLAINDRALNDFGSLQNFLSHTPVSANFTISRNQQQHTVLVQF